MFCRLVVLPGTSGENADECVDLAGSMRINFSE
jgi:hypothetical protein